jgi:hypothetical protein
MMRFLSPAQDEERVLQNLQALCEVTLQRVTGGIAT